LLNRYWQDQFENLVYLLFFAMKWIKMPSSSSSISPKLYERAFELIAGEIQAGILPPGERLTEVGLAKRLGISRAPIRQALAMLADRGMVQKASSNGYAVHGTNGQNTQPFPSEHGLTKELGTLARASWEVIYDDVEKEIVARTSFFQWHVNEVALARHYGVSRTVSRDVLARLQQRGILTKDDKGRWLAPALNENRIRELYELRTILEPIALEKAARHAPMKTIVSLRDRLQTVSGQKKGVDYPTLLDALEQDLHVTLLSYCDNRALLEAISLPQALLVTQHFLFDWTNDMFDSEPFLPEHLAIYDNLIAGDVQRAKHALTYHLEVSCDRSNERICNVAQRITLDSVSYLSR
jgi:DNA-binding GntR family transcriptional regulator